MVTSNTYTFGSTPVDTLLQSSLQLCGIVPSEVDGWKAQSALLSLNLILSDWANRGNNLWLSQTLMMSIIPGQQTYLLPKNVTYIKELTAVQLQNAGNGIPISGEGVAPSITWKGIDYGEGSQVSITYAGIQPFTADSLTLDVQYSFQPKDGNWDLASWYSAFAQPWTPFSQPYLPNQVNWLVPTSPVGARAWRFVNTSGNTDVFLDAQVSFMNPKNSILLQAISENDYYAIGRLQTSQPSSPSSYYLDRQMQPTINLWPVPNNTYDAFVYKAMTTPQDAGVLINQQQVPQRFLRALVYEIAADLSLQFAPDRYATLQSQAQMLHDRAANEDRERVPLRINPVFGRRT